MAPCDLNGQPYTPAKQRPWLNAALLADFAKQLDCPQSEVEIFLDARDAAARKARERVEYEDPYGYERGRRW